VHPSSVTCDQYRFPRSSHGLEAGFDEPLKRILGFQREDDAHNPYARYFPGLAVLLAELEAREL